MGREDGMRKILALAAALLVAAPVFGQAWPQKNVRLVVPFAAGGTTDIVARLLGQKLGDAWGQTVVVENRAGAAGNIGAAEVAKSAPDGYTLFMTTGSIVTANQHIYRNLPFDPERDLVPITNVATGPQVVIVPANSPYRTLAELIAAAKAKPGALNYGHAGIGSQTHLAAENFLHAGGIEMTNVPYKGEAPAVTDVVAGQLNMATVNVAAAMSFINQGKLRALAVTSKARSQQLPAVPAVAETLKGFENSGWFGLMAPAGTPKEIIDKVAGDSAKALESTDLKARLYVQGMTPVGAGPQAMAEQIRAETALWARIVKERNIRVQ
jgi:tripartite-type tricarboxylate transporter receptor subunit TctC